MRDLVGVPDGVSECFRRFAARLGGVVACALALGLAACGSQYTTVSRVNNPTTAGAKGETFGYRKWISDHTEPDLIVIGIHGFCGASIDYANLGSHLLVHQPRTGLYAYEVRGQGSDPIRERRGDIGDPKDWYRDLFAFTQLVRERHPDAKIVWYGESMGGLIAAHALREAPVTDLPCDGLVLSSPVVRFRDDIPAWKIRLLEVAAQTFPLARISMEALSGGQDVQMTQTSKHSAQAETNSYNIKQYTLRLLGTLGRHIEEMNDCAARLRLPVLVLHGGKDCFNTDSDVRGFKAHIAPGVAKTYRNYPNSYHLLMYDAHRETIFRDIERWLNRLRYDQL
ncbi:MAG: alpha/beta fold hydrolase [Verrucomicrobia bacterium]|nr:alpha/beta fold hydrolase [Verrucomicrobiota bacterium]